VFSIRFETDIYPPGAPWPSQVLIRNSVDGWATELDGQWDGQGWSFTFDEATHAGMQFKFVLRGAVGDIYMDGQNLVATDPVNVTYADGTVRFPFAVVFDTSPAFGGGVPVTMRTSLDWNNDYPTSPFAGKQAWIFDFATFNYLGSNLVPPIRRLEFKFIRNGSWSKGANLSFIPWPGGVFTLNDVDVRF
jgi:hypothetical protein